MSCCIVGYWNVKRLHCKNVLSKSIGRSNIAEGVREVENTGNGKSLNLFGWKAFGIQHVFYSLEKKVYLLDEE